MRSNEPGPLTADERALLDALLAHSFPGVDALRRQVQGVKAKKGCECGCGTIELVVAEDQAPRSTAPSPVSAEAQVLGTDGTEVAGLLLFLDDGLLSSLGVYSYDQPLPLPTVDRVRWSVISR